MVNLNDFIHIHDNSLDSSVCEFLIELFELNPEHQEISEDGQFLSFNLTKNKNDSDKIKTIHNDLINDIFKLRDEYYEIFERNLFPDKHAFEQFKILRFMPSEEETFTTYVDVFDYSSARRFLCFNWFLNYNQAGQYEFLDNFISSEQGRLVIYPPFWMFPHKKNLPVNEPQYILKTYLHYK